MTHTDIQVLIGAVIMVSSIIVAGWALDFLARRHGAGRQDQRSR